MDKIKTKSRKASNDSNPGQEPAKTNNVSPVSFIVDSVKRRRISRKALAANFTPLLAISASLIVASPIILLLCEFAGNPFGISAIAFLAALVASIIGTVVLTIQMELAKMCIPGILGGMVLVIIMKFTPGISGYAVLSTVAIIVAQLYLLAIQLGAHAGKDLSLIPEDFIDD